VAIINSIIPKPASIVEGEGEYTLAEMTQIYVEPGTSDLLRTGQYLADRLRLATGYPLAVLPYTGMPLTGDILLTLEQGEAALGEEGYILTITPESVLLAAYRPAGLFRGVQSLRQLFPPTIECKTLQAGPWLLPACVIRDIPRFAWRGAMLDVARHFFSVEDIKAYIDVLAYYKLNRFHLHLSDDQGWRIEIKSWPQLAEYGGSTQVGGGPGGYYSQDEYRDIVAYADSRHIVLVPEIDMPGHTMAALASYPELSREGIMPSLYTGTDVGVSSLDTHGALTHQFVEDVIREVAALTTGPYFHVGGDEAYKTKDEDYIPFIERLQQVVYANGKTLVGWEEIAKADLYPESIVQLWTLNEKSIALAGKATQSGCRVIMSPASRAYLDMKYDPATALGLNWAGFVEVQTSYEWDPAELVTGLGETHVIGVEAPLWSETTETLSDLQFMTFPRLPGINETGWCAGERAWSEYRLRLASHGPRLDAMEVAFYRSPQIPWEQSI
jgi:hexosaminidase